MCKVSFRKMLLLVISLNDILKLGGISSLTLELN